MNPSTALATVLVDEMIAGGVTDAVLCPGSRNAPLSMALHAADLDGRIRLHVRIDERTAGFLALGLAKASGRPVAIATTSGTAVANLHPAVLEAHHSGIRLLVLSADRPPRLRDVGANQVIDQRAVFTGALRFWHEFGAATRAAGQNGPWRSMVCRALAAARGSDGTPGPVQLNCPFDTPLLPDPGDGAQDWPEPLTGRSGPWVTIAAPPAPDTAAATADLSPASNTVGPTATVAAPLPGERALVLADLQHPDAARLAAAGYPVVSEAGGAAGARVLTAGLHLLADAEFLAAHRPERVIVLGRPTLFRQVAALMSDHRITVDVVGSPAHFPDPAGRVRTVAPALGPVTPEDAEGRSGDWIRQWRAADEAAGAAVDGVLAAADGAVSSPALARAVVAALPREANLVIGSSQMPRDVGRFARARDGVRVLANRGVAGIDGTNSTAIGVALASDRPTVALMGDLTFVHDLTALAIGPREPRPDLTIVVANNDGGGIFATLEPGGAAHQRHFERVFATPVGADLASLVRGFGVRYLRVADATAVGEALRSGGPGIRVIEMPVDRAGLRGMLTDVEAAVGRALRECCPPSAEHRPG